MSVIVKGMEMPDTCVDCELYHVGGEYGEYGSCEAHKVIFGEEDDWKYETRPNWCPLRPLPKKHGRLIDADALDQDCGDVCQSCGDYAVFGFSHEQIRNAPTIVEAEGD